VRRKSSNLLGCGTQRIAHRRIQCHPCVGHFLSRNAQGVPVREPIKLFGVTEERPITVLPNVRHYAPNGGQHGIERRTAAPLKRGQHRFR